MAASLASYNLHSLNLEALQKERKVFLAGEVDEFHTTLIVSQLLAFITSNEDVYFYINSPGGSVSHGLAIYDAMQALKKNGITVHTKCLGMAASMGAILLSGGTKGYRTATKNSQVMIHQVSGWAMGTSSDVGIQAKHIDSLKKHLNTLLSKNTGQPIKKVEKDTDRDNYMFAEDAKKYGLIDKVE